MSPLPRPPTIRDVAARAGVSLGTASNALRGTDGVRPGVRLRVEQAARDLGWRANPMARGLRQAKSLVVGLVLPSAASAFHAGFADALEDAVAREGRLLMQAFSRGDPAQEQARVEALLDRRVEGLVLLPTVRPQAALDALVAARVPVVQVGTPLPDPRLDSIALDEGDAMDTALRRLAARGHRTILLLVRYPGLPVTAARIAALRAAPGIRGEVMAFGADHARFDATMPARLAAPDRPTALLASNSILAAWALRALRRTRLQVPRDVALLSFDDPEWAELTDPPLTVMRQPVAGMAAAALALLRQRAAQPALPPRHETLRMELVVRESA